MAAAGRAAEAEQHLNGELPPEHDDKEGAEGGAAGLGADDGARKKRKKKKKGRAGPAGTGGAEPSPGRRPRTGQGPGGPRGAGPGGAGGSPGAVPAGRRLAMVGRLGASRPLYLAKAGRGRGRGWGCASRRGVLAGDSKECGRCGGCGGEVPFVHGAQEQPLSGPMGLHAGSALKK